MAEHLKTLPMKKKSEQSKKFYQYIKILAGKIDKNLKFQFYDSNEKVPNYLRSTDCKMLFWIIEVSNKNPVKLGNICSWGENGVMEIHVVSNGVELFNESNYRLLRKLDEFTTWEVNKTVLNYILKSPSQAGSIIGIEFRENNKDGYNPKVINNIDTLSTEAVLHPSNEDFLHRRSFIRQKLDCDEILKRILFIDATFTVSNADHGRSPLSISILDYNGCEILNTLVTPRSRVNCFGESVHGITELKSREQMDEYDCIRKVHQIVKDRILIGHNMYLKLHHLFIPKYSLMGIRDLATAKVFGKLKVARKLNEQIYALEILKKAFLPNDSNAFLTANSHNNACLIRNIYLAVENEWEDHLPLVPEISSFLADISNNNCSSNTDQSLSTTLKMVTPDFCDNLNGNQILHKPAPSSDVNDDVSDGQQQYCLNNTLATETGQTLELNDESNQLNSLKTNSTAPIGSRILPNPLDNIILSFPIDNSHCNIDIANCQNNDDSDMLSLDELEKVSKPNQSPQDIEFGDYYLDESYIQQSSPDLTVNSDPIPDISEQQILTRNLPFMKSWRISIDLNCNNDDSEGAKITEGVNSDASLLGGNKNHCDNVITGF